MDVVPAESNKVHEQEDNGKTQIKVPLFREVEAKSSVGNVRKVTVLLFNSGSKNTASDAYRT